jgi:hypothetical protein
MRSYRRNWIKRAKKREKMTMMIMRGERMRMRVWWG